MQTIIQFHGGIDVRNLDALPRGTGAAYLEVIQGQGDEYVAKQWRRKLPNTPGIFIAFARA